jgi:hypothetical protein
MALVQTIRAARITLAEVAPKIAFDTRWRDFLVAARQTCCDGLLACPPRARTDMERATQEKWEFSIKRIDRGLNLGTNGECHYANLPLDDLMRDAGYVPRDLVSRAQGDAWYGTLPTVERRLKELIAKRDDAQTRLDRALADE